MSNQPELQKNEAKRRNPVLLLSGLLVAISYIVLLIPFALYSVAQVSAMLGKRFGLLIMVIVFAVLFVLSLLFGSSLLLSTAFLLLISFPFFIIAIAFREKLLPKLTAIIVLLIPLIITFYSFTFLPVLNNTQLDNLFSHFEQNILAKKQEVQKKIETNVSASPENQLVAKYDDALAQVQSLKSIKEFREYMSFNPWQRMIWFVFGFGSIFFFFALLISFANIVFLDLAFEQIEKIKVIIVYVLKNVGQFSHEFVLALKQIPMVLKNKSTNSFFIVKHDLKNDIHMHQSKNSNVKVIRLSLFKNPNPSNRISLRGYSFLCEGKLPSWNFKQFNLPLPLVILAIVFMASVMFWSGGSNELIALLAIHHYSAFIALGCVVSFAILSILTLQGLFTFYIRVSNLVGLLFLLCLFIIGSNFFVGYYVILAIFGSIALLDYVYNWRRKK